MKKEAIRALVAVNSAGFYKKHDYRVVKPVYLPEAGNVYRTMKKLG